MPALVLVCDTTFCFCYFVGYPVNAPHFPLRAQDESVVIGCLGLCIHQSKQKTSFQESY